MNFRQTVRQETNRKYVQMLDGSTPSPYEGEPELDPPAALFHLRGTLHAPCGRSGRRTACEYGSSKDLSDLWFAQPWHSLLHFSFSILLSYCYQITLSSCVPGNFCPFIGNDVSVCVSLDEILYVIHIDMIQSDIKIGAEIVKDVELWRMYMLKDVDALGTISDIGDTSLQDLSYNIVW